MSIKSYEKSTAKKDQQIAALNFALDERIKDIAQLKSWGKIKNKDIARLEKQVTYQQEILSDYSVEFEGMIKKLDKQKDKNKKIKKLLKLLKCID